MSTVTLIGLYFTNVFKSIGALLWNLTAFLPKRLVALTNHVFGGIWQFFLSFGDLFSGSVKFGRWLIKGLKSISAWIGRLIAKTLDIAVLGELLDLIFQVIKPNTRRLNKLEIEEAKKVFADSLPYWKVRVDQASLISIIGSLFVGGGKMGVTTFHTINFNKKISTDEGNADMRWLIHELAHVAQMDKVGIQYLGEALVAQWTEGYEYGRTEGLKGKKLKDFNREQQAKIAEDYYFDVLYGNVAPEQYLPIIEEIRKRRY